MREHSENESPVINFAGERVALGPKRRDLVPAYHRWISDFEVIRTLSIPLRPVTWDEELRWFERGSAPDDAAFTVYERETLRAIGNTALHGINPAQGTATFGILIGEKDCWGRGYATEATRLMLDYAFNALGLYNVMLSVFSNNEPARRAYLRAGFREIGRRREARRVGANVYDEIYMDCIATEFESPVLRALLERDGG